MTDTANAHPVSRYLSPYMRERYFEDHWFLQDRYRRGVYRCPELRERIGVIEERLGMVRSREAIEAP